MSTPPIGTPPGQPAARQATLRDFFAIVFRRRWLILGLFFVVTTTVLLISLTTPALYTSSGRVLVSRGERESSLNSHVQIMNEWEQDLASEVAKVHSDTVMARARKLLTDRALRTGTAPLGIRERSVTVEVVGKSNVIAIGYDDLNPERAQEVCDALLTAFVEYRQQKSMAPTDRMFAVQLDSLRQLIDARSAARESTASQSGVNDPGEMTRAWSAQLGQLESRHDEVAADLAAAQSLLRSVREMQKHPEMDLPAGGVESQPSDNALTGLKSKIADQQVRIATLRERYRDDAPEVANALETLETLQALLRREVNTRVQMAQSRVEQLQARLAVHSQNLAELRAKLESLPRSQERIDELDAEVKTLRSRVEEYTKARDQAHITANTSQAVTIILLNPAGPAVPKNVRDVVRMLLAPGFSLVVGVGLAFFIDGLDLTVRTAGQAEEYLALPVLATLPERRRRRD